MKRKRGSDTVLNIHVTKMLMIMRHTKPEHVRDALKGLQAQHETRSWVRRFYDALHVLQALKLVPVMAILKPHKETRRLLRYTEVVYRHVHSNPGPYFPRSLSVTLSVKERRVYDIFNVLHAIGLVCHTKRSYALTPRLDESASYWWGLLCENWGEVDRTMLIDHQVILIAASDGMRKSGRRQKRTTSGDALVQYTQANVTRLLPQWQTTGLDAERAVSELCPPDRSCWSEEPLERVTVALPEDILQDSEPMLDSVNRNAGHECVYHECDISDPMLSDPMLDSINRHAGHEWDVLATSCFLSNIEVYPTDHMFPSDGTLEQLLEATVFGL